MNINMPEDPQFNKYYRKHQKCLKLNGLQPKTIDAYSRAIRRIGNYFDCRIDHLTSDQLLDYFNELLDSHSWSAVKLDLYGLKFFYTRVLNKTWEDIPLIKPPRTSRIPDILSIEELNRLFAATNRLSYKPGLCSSQVCRRCEAEGTQTYFGTSIARQQGRFGKIASPLRLRMPEDLSQI